MPTTEERHTHHYKHAFECIYCFTHTAFRSHRKGFLEFLKTRLTGKVPFRCKTCKRRFWLRIDPRDI